ncbi:olfactory receptor 14C36-like [Sphaerodactylus townsendi]|uniref:olfactory receptor 14C36-like n=1 Tax=Sphaerodactylus townsendi TaxID=933632 RepID=UPI0020273F50|nr:olfactory receptor 14C36-like [Sphaerodactylus townsendi]
MINQTAATEFFLLGFSNLRELQILHFVIFLSIYLATMTGNFLLILTVAQNPHLHKPMYFFLVNLSIVDACFISTTIPNSLVNSFRNKKWISFSGCVTQVFLVVTFLFAELTFLTIMAYDRYVAICHPLQYQMIMSWNTCLQLASTSWMSSIIYAIIQTASTFRLSFCRSSIKQFFCDIPPLLLISCTDTRVNEWLLIGTVFTVGLFCFMCIFVYYKCIFSAVLKIQSAQGRKKALSTCTPHLIVFTLFFFTCTFSYLKPKALSSPPVDLLAAFLYTELPPLMNPIIYSLRNKEIQMAMQKVAKKLFGFQWVMN